MGDGMAAMAAMILAVMGLMLLGGFLIFSFVAQKIARAYGTTARRAWGIAAIAGVVGTGAAALMIVSIFYENAWAPPPTIQFVSENGANPAKIVFLEDPVRGRPLEWRGVRIPFMGVSTTVMVPRGGIVRVRDLQFLVSGPAETIWPDGSPGIEGAVGNAPPGLGAKHYAAWGRAGAADAEDDLPLDDEELANWIRTRESMAN